MPFTQVSDLAKAGPDIYITLGPFELNTKLELAYYVRSKCLLRSK